MVVAALPWFACCRASPDTSGRAFMCPLLNCLVSSRRCTMPWVKALQCQAVSRNTLYMDSRTLLLAGF